MTAGRRAHARRTAASRARAQGPAVHGGILDRDATLFLFAGAMAVLWIVFGQLAAGTMNDDDVSRYFLVRKAFAHPGLLIHMWGRPLFMLLYVLPARAGYGGVEATTAIVSALTLVVTARIARQTGVRTAFAAVAFTAFQPFFFRMGYSALTEPLAALCLALSLWLAFSGRFALAALAAGTMTLARLEAAPLVPLLLWPAIRARRWRVLLLAALPLALWSLGGTLAEGDPFWLPDVLLHGRMTRSLPPLPFSNYFRSFPLVTGGVILPLFMVGLFRRGRFDGAEGRRDQLRAVFGVTFVVLVLLGWDKIPFGASIGYLRHFVSISPVIGVLAAHGLDRWDARERQASRAVPFVAATAGLLWAVAMHAFHAERFVWEHPSNLAAEPWIWSAGGIAGFAWLLWFDRLPRAARVAGFAALAAAAVFIAEPPMGLSPERAAVKSVVKVARAPEFAGRLVATNHPWFPFLAGGDPDDRTRYVPMTLESLASLPAGSLAVWDSHFSDRLSGNVPFSYFKEHQADYRLICKKFVARPPSAGGRSASDVSFGIFLFQKLVPPSP